MKTRGTSDNGSSSGGGGGPYPLRVRLHPSWTTANQYTVAGESHYQSITHANPYGGSVTAEDKITNVPEHW